MNATDVAAYLQAHPDFFNDHAELFASLQVPHPHNGQAVSLAERQILALRERLRGLEMRTADMVRNARENEVIADRLWTWTRHLLIERDLLRLPDTLAQSVSSVFGVPDVAVRVWNIDPDLIAHLGDELPAWAMPVDDSISLFARSLMVPYCGPNSGFEAALWLAQKPASVVLVPLRVGMAPQAFGLVVLGSPDPDRFSATMGTAFLSRLAELASAALSRLLPER